MSIILPVNVFPSLSFVVCCRKHQPRPLTLQILVHPQTFALQTGQSTCADVLQIEIYYTDEAGGHASDKDSTTMPTPFCLVAR